MSALALVMVAFAHKPITLSPAYGADLAAYVLPDGTVPAICHDGENGKDPHKAHGDHGCEACRISAGAMLPAAPVVASIAAPRLLQHRLAVASLVADGKRLRPGAPPQGPPALQV